MRRTGLLLIVLGVGLTALPAAAAPKLLDEEYQAIYMGTGKVGYLHVQNLQEQRDGRTVIHTRTIHKMELKRFGQTMRSTRTTDEYAEPDGTLLEARSVNQQLGSKTVVTARLVDDQMRITIDSGGQQRKMRLPWDGTVLGSQGMEVRFKDTRLEPGKVLEFKMLSLELPSVGINEVRVEVIGRETTSLLEGRQKELWRSQVTMSMYPGLKTTVWTDQVKVWKSAVPIMGGMYTYRVSAAEALAPSDEIQVDAMLKSLVKLEKDLPRPYRTTEVVYDVTLTKPELAEMFKQPPHQTVLTDDGEGHLRVRIRRQKPEAAPATQPVEAVYTQPNAYIQSDDAKLRELAEEAAGEATEPIEVIRNLTRWVAQYVEEKNYSTGMATAADVARTRAGDCTEHAVLLAALARARKLPSRVAVGLIYMKPNRAFAYHMWTEVYVGRWLSADGTAGWVGVPPTHIKLADSSLHEASGMTAMLPAVRLVGNVGVKLVSYEHGDR